MSDFDFFRILILKRMPHTNIHTQDLRLTIALSRHNFLAIAHRLIWLFVISLSLNALKLGCM